MEVRSDQSLIERVAAFDWYHTQELAPGVETPGMFDLRPHVGRYGIPADLKGMRVLDVGTFEGFWAFELERRGAEVVALDVDRVSDLDWPRHLRPAEDRQRGEGFRIVAEALGSEVRRVGTTIYDATPELLGGRFDLVFCGSVLIHLRDPVLALERLADLCSGRLILCEEYSRRLPWSSRGVEFHGDSEWMTWWRPTTTAWERIIRVGGFTDVRRHGRFRMRFRAQRGAVPHVVFHASGPRTGGS